MDEKYEWFVGQEVTLFTSDHKCWNIGIIEQITKKHITLKSRGHKFSHTGRLVGKEKSTRLRICPTTDQDREELFRKRMKRLFYSELQLDTILSVEALKKIEAIISEEWLKLFGFDYPKRLDQRLWS